MVEIPPREPLGEHVVIGLVVGELGKSGLHEVSDPPHPEPQEDQFVGPQRGI